MSNHALIPLADQVIAYTDGACRGNPGKGGFGAVVILPTGEQWDICGGEDHTTNNRMELMGAIAALEHSPTQTPIQIWSDSSYVIKGISEWITGWKNKNWKNVKNVELWQRLDKLCVNRKIDWQWVKGHAGHDGNEYADKLANQGIDQLPKTFAKIVKNTYTANSDLAIIELKAKKPEIEKPEFKKKETAMNQLATDDNFDITENLSEAFTDAEFDGYDDAYSEDDIFLQALDNDAAASNLDADFNLDSDLEYVTSPANPPSSLSLTQTTQTIASNPNFAVFTNRQGQFVAQNDALIAQRPTFNGITSQPNPSFIPLLPIADWQCLCVWQWVIVG